MTAIKTKLKELFISVLKSDISPVDLGDTDLIDRLNIDSIISLEILICVEDVFGITIDDSDLSPKLVDSIGYLSSYVENKLAVNGTASVTDAPESSAPPRAAGAYQSPTDSMGQ